MNRTCAMHSLQVVQKARKMQDTHCVRSMLRTLIFPCCAVKKTLQLDWCLQASSQCRTTSFGPRTSFLSSLCRLATCPRYSRDLLSESIALHSPGRARVNSPKSGCRFARSNTRHDRGRRMHRSNRPWGGHALAGPQGSNAVRWVERSDTHQHRRSRAAFFHRGVMRPA